MNDLEKMNAVFGVEITVYFEPTSAELKATPEGEPPTLRSETIRVRGIAVRNYAAARRAMEEEKESEFIAISIGKTRDWVNTLEPTSYRLLANTVTEANPDFFAACGRWQGLREGLKLGVQQAVAASQSANLSQTSSPQVQSTALTKA